MLMTNPRATLLYPTTDPGTGPDMVARRTLIALIVLCVSLGLGALLWRVLAPGGWTLPKLVMLAAFAGIAPWTGLCVANAVIGFLLLILARDPVRPAFPQPPPPNGPLP